MQQFFDDVFPQSESIIEEVAAMSARVRRDTDSRHLRPGGTVSGPVLMSVADAAMYAALLGEIGPVALAVTTSLNINFLRKPAAGRAVIGEARLIKLGKRLAVGDISIYSEGTEEPVAHATATYSIPPPEHRG